MFGKIAMELSLLDALDPTSELEQCGLLIGQRRKFSSLKWDINEIIVLQNRHPNPSEHFRILRKDLPTLLESRIIGIIHTHPFSAPEGPSWDDMTGLKRGYLGIVYSATGSVVFYTRHGVITTTRVTTTTTKK